MKKTLPFAVLFCLFSCGSSLKQSEFPATLSINKLHRLQIIWTESPPAALDKILFYQHDTVVKEIPDLYKFSRGDTIVIDIPLRPHTEYNFIGFPRTGGLEFFHFKYQFFWVDLKADTLISNHEIDTTHKKVTY